MKEMSWEDYLKTAGKRPSGEKPSSSFRKQSRQKKQYLCHRRKCYVEKRKPPCLLFFLFLLFCILTGYYFSGIFLEPGLALSNINSRLEYIISHPFAWYWNEKSAACIIGTFLAWLYILSQYLYHQRDFQFGRNTELPSGRIRRKLADS